MQQLLLLLAWCYYRHLFLCVTPAFELAFPVSPHYSAALHLSGTCPGTALLCTGMRRTATVNAGIQETCSDTLTSVVEQMIHGRSTSLLQGNCVYQRGGMNGCEKRLLQPSDTKRDLRVAQHSVLGSTAFRAGTGRWLPGCSQQAP